MPDKSLSFRRTYTFGGRLRQFPLKEKLTFTVPSDENPIELVIGDEQTIVVTWTCTVAEPFVIQLENGTTGFDAMPHEAQKESRRIGRAMSDAARRLLAGIKYYLNEPHVNETVGSKPERHGNQWSADGQVWKACPQGIHAELVLGETLNRIDGSTPKHLQNLLNSYETFLPFSLRHLHRAINESENRHKWIDATIAAELAIKEFLIRMRPDFETLLLEMPSPPLHKMYGSILLSVIGEESPMKSELQKGAEIRNKLIHRPEDQILSHQDVARYIFAAQVAINHLLLFLLPNDPVIQESYQVSKLNYNDSKLTKPKG